MPQPQLLLLLLLLLLFVVCEAQAGLKKTRELPPVKPWPAYRCAAWHYGRLPWRWPLGRLQCALHRDGSELVVAAKAGLGSQW